MSDEERIEQLELEVKVLRANNKGLKDKIDEQSKEIEELKDFITKLQATKDRLDSYDKENTLEIEKLNKEIEELTDKNKKLKDKAKELIFEKQELTSALLDSTPNDKIKAKIEELEKQDKESKLSHNYLVIPVLQSLLEKE